MLKILIPTDGSTHAMAAVHHALHLVGAGLKARFVVANVQEPANLYELVTAHDPAVLQKVNAAASRDQMREAVTLLSAAGQAVEQDMATGDAADMLVEILERQGCQAVIMATHGAGLRASVIGSVSQDMVQRSPVPVTLVRPRPEPSQDV
jgi:nucleotide-binding universal stress UspA family protein